MKSRRSVGALGEYFTSREYQKSLTLVNYRVHGEPLLSDQHEQCSSVQGPAGSGREAAKGLQATKSHGGGGQRYKSPSLSTHALEAYSKQVRDAGKYLTESPSDTRNNGVSSTAASSYTKRKARLCRIHKEMHLR